MREQSAADHQMLFISDTAEIVRLQEDAIKEHSQRVTAEGRGQLSILEAGCGQKWLLDLAGVNYRLSGIDMDPDALAMRKSVRGDLDEAIVGDVCTVDLPEASFDVVYSNFVLEHIKRADIALDNMTRWLRPGGVLVFMIPDPQTVRGFFTRLLPFPAHIWYHRYVKGRPHAGEVGHSPYPTYFHPILARKRLRAYLAERGIDLRFYADSRPEGDHWLIRTLLAVFKKTVSLISLEQLSADYNNMLYIGRKASRGNS